MEALNKHKFDKTTALTFASIGLLVQQSIADIGYEITFVICPMLVGDNSGHRQKEWIMPILKQAGLKNGNNKDWQLWQQHNHSIELTTQDMFYHYWSIYIGIQ